MTTMTTMNNLDKLLELTPNEFKNDFNKYLYDDIRNVVGEYLGNFIMTEDKIYWDSNDIFDFQYRDIEYYHNLDKTKCSCCGKKSKNMYFIKDQDDGISGTNGNKSYLECKKCTINSLYKLIKQYSRDEWMDTYYEKRPTKKQLTEKVNETGDEWNMVINWGMYCIKHNNNIENIIYD